MCKALQGFKESSITSQKGSLRWAERCGVKGLESRLPSNLGLRKVPFFALKGVYKGT